LLFNKKLDNNYDLSYHDLGDFMKINIIEARSDLGVHVDGSNLGPKELNNNLNLNSFIIEKENIVKSKDKTDLRKNEEYINIFTKNIFNTTLNIFEKNEFPLLLGGDHSTVIGSALASQKYNKSIGIIWIDAHLDYNTFETTITGNIHGLPLAAINGLCCDLTNFCTNNYIDPKNTVVVGYRAKETNADAELNNIKKMGVTVFTTDDLNNEGISNIMEKAFNIASNNTNGVHISYDLDVIDPKIAPGVSIPEIDGINEQQAYEIMDELVNNKNVIKSMDLVEFNPLNDKENKTKNIALNLLKKFLNKKQA